MYDVIVIGSGVIGASVSYALSQYDLNVLVLEKENDVAMGTTRANSAIVHAGYDPEPETLMAQLNIYGSVMMEGLCRKLSVRYKRIGSLVLAFNDEDLEHLNTLYERGKKNGVPALRILTGDEAREMEPSLSDEVKGALLAPTAAIVDPWGLCIGLCETAAKNGVTFKLNSPVTGLTVDEDHITVHTPSESYDAHFVINCAGCHSHEISAMAGEAEWTPVPARGEYYLLDKAAGSLVNHVIFQCPTAAGKGVLIAPTVHGNLIVGPNADQVDDPDDTANTQEGLKKVADEASRSVKGLNLRQSIRNFAGVRAITSEDDFILRPSVHTPRLIHAAGIKSPGLSAAPAIASYLMTLLQEQGLELEKKENWNGSRMHVCFKELSPKNKQALIDLDPRFGRVICRCETITEGEIIAAIHSPIPPCSVDGIKRRAGAGMGRCQGGFCSPRVVDILARELGKDPTDILQDGDETFILTGHTKGGDRT